MYEFLSTNRQFVLSESKKFEADDCINGSQNSAGILGKQAFDNEREMITCFLMIWFGYNGSSTDIKGSFYGARNSVVGKGICSPWFARKGVKMTANQIDVSEKAAVFLRCFLGQDRFNAVLTCSDKLASRRKPSPLDDTEQIEVWKREYGKEYYARPGNKEKKLEYKKEYNARPGIKEKQLEYKKEYNARPGIKEKKREYDKEYYARPGIKEKQREYKKEYNARPGIKEKQREYEKEYYARPGNKEKRREYQKEYNEEYRQKVRKRSEEIIFQTANIALNEYKQRLKEGTLNHLAKREWKSLLVYIIKQDPKGKLDTISKYTNVDKMKNRLGVTNTDTKDCLSKYFPKE